MLLSGGGRFPPGDGTFRVVDELSGVDATEALLLEANLINKYRRINHISVIGCGLGGYSNLLRVIPHLSEDVSGAIIVIIYGAPSHVDAFTDYLDAISNMNVVRMQDGLSLEGGHCYVGAAEENVYMKPFSAQYTIRRSKPIPGYGPVDLIMNSITSVFKNRSTGLILSGIELDGEKGVNAIKKNQGTKLVDVYAIEGIWYDALATISSMIDKSPEDQKLIAIRKSLLEQVDLHIPVKN